MGGGVGGGGGGKLPVSCARGAVFLDVHFNHNLRHPDDHIMSLTSMAFEKYTALVAPALNMNYEHRYNSTFLQTSKKRVSLGKTSTKKNVFFRALPELPKEILMMTMTIAMIITMVILMIMMTKITKKHTIIKVFG